MIYLTIKMGLSREHISPYWPSIDTTRRSGRETKYLLADFSFLVFTSKLVRQIAYLAPTSITETLWKQKKNLLSINKYLDSGNEEEGNFKPRMTMGLELWSIRFQLNGSGEKRGHLSLSKLTSFVWEENAAKCREIQTVLEPHRQKNNDSLSVKVAIRCWKFSG